MNPHFFDSEQQEMISKAIRNAENQTSGEIRVHLERKCEGNVLDRAARVFADLEMHKTNLRNGVLFYLAYEDRKFAILGDAGINSAVAEGFWDQITVRMQQKFRAGHFLEGLIEGVEMAGHQLNSNFPRSADDINELSDKVSFG